MIHIRKSSQAPSILRKRGRSETESLCEAYDVGERRFEFKSDIYGAKSVKNKLRKNQHDKCCFCESKISHVSYGDVEHFRPKGGYRQQAGDNLSQPGYYWLAYEWTNLFLCCQLCNQRHKRNLFPLEKTVSRAKNHKADLSIEEPLFINPSLLDPEDYISFRRHEPYAIDDNHIGNETIRALELDRSELNERREKLSDLLHKLYFIANFGPTPPDESRRIMELIGEYAEDDAEYAGMVRAGIKSGFALIE